MNKMNGGYVMLKYDASQDKLKDAYDSNKPVIVYDSNNKGLWAKITESSGTYFIEPLVGASDIPETPKLYLHIITASGIFSSDVVQFAINIYSFSNTPFTKESLYAFVKDNRFTACGYYYVSASTTTYTVNIVSATSNKFELIQNAYLSESKQYNVNGFTTFIDTIKEV